ncbi:MAG: site-specific DNA-methyltransferase [Promethearchaeati archaeon SRVP18_Atabeyarchaeia-1]
MSEIDDGSVHLVVTSPPYPMIEMWDSQFRKLDGRIDDLFLQMVSEKASEKREEIVSEIYSLMHENLAQVWREAYRVLVDGGIACINIGDATRTINGTFRLFPNHVPVVEHCEKAGFMSLPYILWKKPTTKPRYRGKGAFLGSGMLPPNAYVMLDCEFILIFRKGGLRKFKPKDAPRYESKYTKQERDRWFTQVWGITGMKQSITEVERRVAAFPEEIPRRIISMFSIVGDTVLDPFIGTGTTLRAAIELRRSSIGYEIDEEFRKVIEQKAKSAQKATLEAGIEILHRN